MGKILKEIWIEIFSKLTPKILCRSVMLVCKKFSILAKSHKIWKGFMMNALLEKVPDYGIEFGQISHTNRSYMLTGKELPIGIDWYKEFKTNQITKRDVLADKYGVGLIYISEESRHGISEESRYGISEESRCGIYKKCTFDISPQHFQPSGCFNLTRVPETDIIQEVYRLRNSKIMYK
jgi:hypothetical protein